VALYKHLQDKCPSADIHKIVQTAVETEESFITEALPCRLIGMDAEQMKQYIRYVGDRLMKQLGETPIWGAENPFAWMETISLEGKTNFFEKRVGDYSKRMVTEGDGVRFDEEF
jgi:ribonucleotide reductase beta subunit family protein with ferritin-like domain